MISKTIAIAVVFGFLGGANWYNWFQLKKTKHVTAEMFMLAGVHPACFVLILEGHWCTVVGWLLWSLQLILLYFGKQKKILLSRITRKTFTFYLLFSYVLSGIFISVLSYRQGLSESEIISSPLFILSCFIGVWGLTEVLSYWYKKENWGKSIEEEKSIPHPIEKHEKIKSILYKSQKRGLTRWDFLWILLLTSCFSGMVFYHLGSMQAPQTYFTLEPCAYDDLLSQKSSPQESTISLDLGEVKSISQIILYLGDADNCVVKIDYFSAKQNTWIPVEEALSLTSNFEWNTVSIDAETRYIRIIERTKEAFYGEIVVYDTDGNMVMPTNADTYKELFDEQELFPYYNTFFYHTIFDEAYYASSEHQFLRGVSMNEQTHPPLGKAIMSLGILLFGTTPFGWRFVVAVFGVLMVPVMYLFLLELIQQTRYAVMGSILFCTDFLHITLSRIGTLDSCIAFFILLEIAIMYHILFRFQRRRKPYLSKGDIVWLLLCALVAGIGVAIKWTGVFALLGIAICYIGYIMVRIMKQEKEKKQTEAQQKEKKFWYLLLLISMFFCGSIVVGTYILSFLPFYRQMGYDSFWQGAIQKSIAMLHFHEGAIFTHQYASNWYTWSLDWKPLLDAVNWVQDNKVSTVATFGNPILWWTGIPAFFWILYRACYKKDKKAAFLSIVYLCMLLPWVFIVRTAFIYQYYGCSMINIAILMDAFSRLEKKHKRWLLPFTVVSVGVMCLFYPVLTGLAVDGNYVKLCLEWLKNWKFT